MRRIALLMIALVAKRLDFFSLAWSGCFLWMAASARREGLRTFVEASTSQEFRDRPTHVGAKRASSGSVRKVEARR